MSTRQLLSAIDAKLVQTAISDTRPTTIADGVDISTWRTGTFFTSQMAAILIDGDQAMSIDAPTGGSSGVELWGYRLSQWWRIGFLNDATAIEIAGNAQGYAAEVDIIGIFDRIAVCGTVSAGAAIAKLIPIEVWS